MRGVPNLKRSRKDLIFENYCNDIVKLTPFKNIFNFDSLG
jgi:hypothetical protein